MKKILLICIFGVVNILNGYSQEYSKEDSMFIYKNLLIYDEENNIYEHVDIPFVEEFCDSIPKIAEYYCYKATFIRSIPAWQRVILVDFLPYEQKRECLRWIYKHLDMDNEEEVSSFIRIQELRESVYWTNGVRHARLWRIGLSYEEIGIPIEVVKKYCSDCSYK